jgi:vacuolar-type H+-ATPase subunit H
VSEIDILFLVDRLESLINAGQRVPFTNKIMIDEKECLDIIDQMRIVVPEEIKQARRVSQDRDRITAQAQAEAERIVKQAQERAEQLLQERELLKLAEQRSQEIIDEATRRAEEIREGADAYALEVLQTLYEELERYRHEIERGIARLERTLRQAAHSTMPAPEVQGGGQE